jgi:CRP-like cAMP-binding protein
MLEFQQKEDKMKKYIDVLSHCPLFAGIEPSQIPSVIQHLHGKTVNVPKGNPVLLEGEPCRFLGIVLSGAVQVVNDDYYGNQSVLAVLHTGELFAEVFSFADLETIPVSVFAQKDSLILLLDCNRILNPPSNCNQTFQHQIIHNLLRIMARKNLALTQKIQYMSKKTTKEKLMAFLLDQAKQHDSSDFSIPYDRQTLANYLGVERSAMSAEIGKLKKEGIIDTKGSWFYLK